MKIGDRVRVINCDAEPDFDYTGEEGTIIEIDNDPHLPIGTDIDGAMFFAESELEVLP